MKIDHVGVLTAAMYTRSRFEVDRSQQGVILCDKLIAAWPSAWVGLRALTREVLYKMANISMDIVDELRDLRDTAPDQLKDFFDSMADFFYALAQELTKYADGLVPA